MADSLSLVWGHLVHFAKFTIFKTDCFSPNFNLIHPNFIHGILIMGQYRLFHCQTFKKLWHFKIFLNTGPYAAGNFKSAISPTIFIGAHPIPEH